jgi:hypothetical protein
LTVTENGRHDLLQAYGRYYGDQRFAVAFTAGTEGTDAKKVATRGWDKTAPLADGNYGASYILGRGQSKNPVIVLRPSNLIVLECDTEDDLARIQELDLPDTVTVRSSEPYKRHLWFRPAPDLESLPYVAFRFESGKLTADSGRYFLAPPSIHPSGAIYTFLPGHGPDEIEIATLPRDLYQALAKNAQVEDDQLRELIEIDPDAKIPEGSRRAYLFRYACMLRRWGLSRTEILEQVLHYNETRCSTPVERRLVEVQVDGAMRKRGGQEIAEPRLREGHIEDLPQFASEADDAAEDAIKVVTLHDFVSVTEDTAEPLIGDRNDSLLPVNGLLLMYGDGGAGKTTLSVDALAHLASGTDWLNNQVQQPLRILLIENEGPRGPFREMLARKVERWNGNTFTPNVHVLEEPWTYFTLKEPDYRHALADQIDRHEIDLVIVGPLASIGAKGTGTPDDVNEFVEMVGDLRRQTERVFALWIVHHENKQGDVSGAWERVPDTLVHVSAQGNGRTRVNWRKVRWSSRLHGTTTNLLWDDGGFTIDEARIRDLHLELVEAFQNDDRWRTAREAAGLVSANQDKVRLALINLVENGRMSFEIGPEGRKPNAKCWRLRSDSDSLSHHESHDLLGGGPEATDSPTPPIRGVGEVSQQHPHPPTDSDPPAQQTQNDDDDPEETARLMSLYVLEPEPTDEERQTVPPTPERDPDDDLPLD